MFFKIMFVLAVCTATAVLAEHAHSSQHISKHDEHPEPVYILDKHHKQHIIDYYTQPKYKFEYKVDDHHTGDHKQQHEHRDKHHTESDYSLHVEHIVPKHHHH